MEYKLLGRNKDIALIQSTDVLIQDVQSALDFIATAQYETGCDQYILYKSCVADGFFILSTGLAGAVLQKFVTYGKRLAVVGDYAKYTSRPLHAFIYESNRGGSVFFVSTVEEAVAKLEGTA